MVKVSNNLLTSYIFLVYETGVRYINDKWLGQRTQPLVVYKDLRSCIRLIIAVAITLPDMWLCYSALFR